MSNPAIWFEIYVQDMPRAKRFYETVFERTLEKLNSPELELWAFPMDQQLVGAAGALVKMDGVEPGGNNTLVYFACEDCAVEAARALEAGGRVQREKFSIGECGHIALVNDTEGNLIGLHSMR
ncbi:MAG: VOC family protein [Nitrococcus mobilis]|nr:VOC family protein [Nitrococcus mobilis]